MASRKASRSSRNNTRKNTRKNNMSGGAKKGSKWTRFVAKVHKELKRKNPGAKLGDAMKVASKRKNEM